MFDGLVERYDLLNRLISLGLDRGWRRAAIRAVAPAPGDRILDLGCGTGDLLAMLTTRADASLDAQHDKGLVSGCAWPVGVDVSAAMLGRARGRLGEKAGLVRGSAFELPFGNGAFQGAVSAFVLRNLRDLEGAMAELARVLAPGARIGLLDATEPHPALRPLFDLYFRVAAPALGALVGRRGAYQYLAASLAQIPAPAEMCRLLAAAGFADCAARPLTLGMVTLFTARRP